MANNDDLAKHLQAAGDAVGEKLWRLPLGDAYDRDIDSDAADVKNIGSARAAGSTIGGQFPAPFGNDVPRAPLPPPGAPRGQKGPPTVAQGAPASALRHPARVV